MSPGQIYHLPTTSYPTLFGTTTPYKILVYTPPARLAPGYTSGGTYTPPDSNPMFDGNDELSFLATTPASKPAARSRAPPVSTRRRVKR